MVKRPPSNRKMYDSGLLGELLVAVDLLEKYDFDDVVIHRYEPIVPGYFDSVNADIKAWKNGLLYKIEVKATTTNKNGFVLSGSQIENVLSGVFDIIAYIDIEFDHHNVIWKTTLIDIMDVRDVFEEVLVRDGMVTVGMPKIERTGRGIIEPVEEPRAHEEPELEKELSHDQ